ncbi:hypothetical protein YC2023_058381 [Brassica napus]
MKVVSPCFLRLPLRVRPTSFFKTGVRHSIFESLRLSRSSKSIASSLLRFWDSLNFKKYSEFMRIIVLFLDEKVNFVIHGFIPAGRANHYMPSLKAGSIVKVDCFEFLRCSSMYKITDKSRSRQEIQETIPTDTKVATTYPHAHSSCLMKIADMHNVNMPMLLSSYKKYINLFKIR